MERLYSDESVYANIFLSFSKDINTEEDLLNVGTTSYHNLFGILSTLEPFSELWHVVLEFHESYDVWCNRTQTLLLRYIE